MHGWVSQPNFVDMDVYNQLHFPSFPLGGLGSLFVSYACISIVLFLFIITRGDSNDTDTYHQKQEAAKRFLIRLNAGSKYGSAARVFHSLTGVSLSIRTHLSGDWPLVVRWFHPPTHIARATVKRTS